MWFMDLVVILWVCTFCMFNGEFEVETDRMDCGEAIPGDGVPLDIGWSCGATGMVAVVLMGGISEPCTGGTEGSARLHCSDTDLWKRMWAEHLVVVEEEDFFYKCYVTRCINSSVGFQVEVRDIHFMGSSIQRKCMRVIWVENCGCCKVWAMENRDTRMS